MCVILRIIFSISINATRSLPLSQFCPDSPSEQTQALVKKPITTHVPVTQSDSKHGSISVYNEERKNNTGKYIKNQKLQWNLYQRPSLQKCPFKPAYGAELDFPFKKNSIYLSMNPIYTWILNPLLQLWSPQSIMRSQFPWTCTILERFDDNSCIFITSVIIIIIIMILCKPSSHLSPLKPKGHEHVYPLWWPLQVAPFWHILAWHSSSSSKKLQEWMTEKCIRVSMYLALQLMGDTDYLHR